MRESWADFSASFWTAISIVSIPFSDPLDLLLSVAVSLLFAADAEARVALSGVSDLWRASWPVILQAIDLQYMLGGVEESTFDILGHKITETTF